jgi:hypothetical protein
MAGHEAKWSWLTPLVRKQKQVETDENKTELQQQQRLRKQNRAPPHARVELGKKKLVPRAKAEAL